MRVDDVASGGEDDNGVLKNSVLRWDKYVDKENRRKQGTTW